MNHHYDLDLIKAQQAEDRKIATAERLANSLRSLRTATVTETETPSPAPTPRFRVRFAR